MTAGKHCNSRITFARPPVCASRRSSTASATTLMRKGYKVAQKVVQKTPPYLRDGIVAG
jgi:hypothetical protein